MLVVVVLLSLLISACNSSGLPTTPSETVFPTSPSTNGSPAAAIPPVPATVLSIAMPIDGADIAANAFALLPFGYHGADHASPGHSGWDIEYRIGAQVRAAADGVVQAIEPDTVVPGRSRVTIEHALGAHIYRTVYANLSSVREEIVLEAAVVRGQPIGVAGTLTLTTTTDNTTVAYAMSHFQVDDFETHREGLDPKAVTPEPFLNAAGRAIFDRIWPRAAFAQELTEPFISMSRDQRLPLTRTWRLESGDGPAGLTFTRTTNADHRYLLLTQSGTAIESGAVLLHVLARPFATIDLVTPTGPRLGIYDIVGDQMRLALGSPGAPRPVDLGAASVYRTSKPVLGGERVSRNARGTRVEG